jgi:alpha-L-fucosidase
MKHCLTLALIACSALTLHAEPYTSDWASLDQRPVPHWWREAKFGIFIHWGLYAVPAYAPTDADNVYAKYSEHYDNRVRTGNAAFTNFHARTYGPRTAYADFATQFRAEHFDPDRWADLFKKSGARYIVLTSKHHDGFALWPSAYSPRWNAQALGPHRDLAGDLTEAVKKAGLHMGFYYSLLEWGNPLYSKESIGRWAAEMNLPQMKELVTRYSPDIVWTDGEWDFSDEELRATDFISWLYNESPVKDTVVVNDRWGKKTRGLHGGHYTTEYDLVHSGSALDTQFVHPWEECRGIGGSFGFNRFETTEHYMTSAQCIETLAEKVSRGGNLLLNIGPQADGLIPVIMEERLRDMGRWLEVNGEAIYATAAWRRRPKNMRETQVYFTRKPDALYAICVRWPQGPLVVEGVSKAAAVSLLGSPLPVAFACAGGRLTIQPPAVNPGNMPCEHAWTFKIADPQDE